MTPRIKTLLATVGMALGSLATTWEGLHATIEAAAYNAVGAQERVRWAIYFAVATLVLRTVKGYLDSKGNQRAKETAEAIQNAEITTTVPPGAPIRPA